MKEEWQSLCPPEIPEYQIFVWCGTGGGGTVWGARDARGNIRAVKVVPVDPRKDPNRFLKGIRAVSSFAAVAWGNRYLMTVYHIGTGNGFWYYVMDLADNRCPEKVRQCYEPDSLAARLHNGRQLPAEEAFPVIRGLLDGVQALHKAQFAHCDLKPENIVFVQGEMRICDPELVCLGGQENHAGTREYLPPEERNAFACDIYAIGKIMYRLYSGMAVQKFPELPPDRHFPQIRSLNQLALRCCTSGHPEEIHSIDALSLAVDRVLPRRWKRYHHRNRWVSGLVFAVGLVLIFLAVFL